MARRKYKKANHKKFDGRLVTYWFGDYDTKTWKCEATTVKKAIRMFRTGVLFPHAYCRGRIGEERMNDSGYTDTVYLRSKPGSKIQVFVQDDRENVIVAEIDPEDNGADFQPNMIPGQVRALIEAADAAVQNDDEEEVKSLALPGMTTGISSLKRREMEEAQLTIKAKMGALERQKREMESMISAMRAELKARMEQIWMIELFLGSNEEVHVLSQGTPAPASQKIAVHQRVLCMDEELAVHHFLMNQDNIKEFDWSHIEGFDQWLLADKKNLNTILPEDKGIVALRVRRHAKERFGPKYEGMRGMWAKIEEEEADRCVYLLIRNGENIYRLWVDVSIWPRFFPRIDEWDWINNPEDSWRRKRNQEKAKEKAKHYVAGLLVLQGLLQRSTVFHPLPRGDIDVFNPEHATTYTDCIRDDEHEKVLTDGSLISKVTWQSYKEWLRSQLRPGIRVAVYGHGSLWNRTGIKSLYDGPENGGIYILDKGGEVVGKNYYTNKYDWSFLYLPDDQVLKSDNWGWTGAYEKRSKRVRYHVASKEVWPVDFISWRVVNHLLLDRNERKHYSGFMHIMAGWWKQARDQRRREKPFIDLALRQAGMGDDDRARAERLMRWWKVKNKYHRTLGDDEPKALRMVVQALKAGKDWDEDPERFLGEQG